MQRNYADLPLHHGRVPRWLAERMSYLGILIMEAIIQDYGKSAFLRKLADPLWFQSFGAVLGMDWHSSGVTTSVMGALKTWISGLEKEYGIYICGGRGKHSLKTPDELRKVGKKTGVDAESLVRASRLSAKVDNTAIQDGFQLYLHSFVVTDKGEWAVVQQGMKGHAGMARRYHWHSKQFKEYLEQPHTAVCGSPMGRIINLTHKKAKVTRQGILEVSCEDPDKMMKEVRQISLPKHHDVRVEDVDLKRLGSILALAHDSQPGDFESLLLLNGLGPRTLQSLTLVSEVIHGTPSRFSDPARFSFAHGGKDGHPFPVPLKVYDKTIHTLESSIKRARIGHYDKIRALKNLHDASKQIEKRFKIDEENAYRNFDKLIAKERRESYKYGGRTVGGWAKAPVTKSGQIALF